MLIDACPKSSLVDFCSVSSGYPFRGAIDGLPPGPVAVIQMRDVSNGPPDYESLTRVTLPTERRLDLLKPADVIFTTRGRRNSALALREVPGPAVCSPHFFILRTRDSRSLLPEFIAWQINQKPAQASLQQAATGSYILNITRAAIEGMPIAIPPLEVQHAIVELANAARRERDLINVLIDNRQRQLDAVAAQILTPERLPT